MGVAEMTQGGNVHYLCVSVFELDDIHFTAS